MERCHFPSPEPSKPVRDYTAAELDALLGEFLEKPATAPTSLGMDRGITAADADRVEELLRSIPELPGEDAPVVS